MTVRELYNFGKKVLLEAGCENPAFDARCLLEKELSISTNEIFLKMFDDVDSKKVDDYNLLLNRRLKKEPLQYILGTWPFMDFNFKVGKGVLIPRQDTETLVEFAIDKLKNVPSPNILDICSGSGCIAISMAKFIHSSKVFAIELSDVAIEYIKDNIILNNANNVFLMKHDVLKGHKDLELPQFDMILSNPPYIPTADIQNLEYEVKMEPDMALDGGEDGLVFYRYISEHWCNLLKPGGIVAVECGINQSENIKKIFSQCGFADVFSIKDLCGIERVVVAVNRS